MRALLLLLCLWLTGCSVFSKPLEVYSEPFRISANTHTSSQEEMQELLKQAEAFHSAIVAISPPDMRPDPLVEVSLNGTLRKQTPYVDETGTVQLWRFPAGEGGYSAMFAHELVHAIAFDQIFEADSLESPDLGFYVEGWAEYAAMLVDPGKVSFPFYGFNEDVVVGHWLAHGGLTLSALRSEHIRLNARCEFQGYGMRASWFRYIDEVLGRDVLHDVVAAREGWSPEDMENILGMSLRQVDADWRAWVLARYEAHPNADSEAVAYRERIYWYEPCVETESG